MAYWLVRLGRDKENDNARMYRDLAGDKYSPLKVGEAPSIGKCSIVKIGFGIQADVSTEDKSGIRKHLRSVGQWTSHKPGLIYKFTKGINDKDIVICPFGDDTTALRIGEFQGNCGSVASLINNKTKLTVFLNKHPNSKEQPHIDVKPARKVKWLTKEMELNDLGNILRTALARPRNSAKIKIFRATTNHLKSLHNQNIQNILSQINPRFII